MGASDKVTGSLKECGIKREGLILSTPLAGSITKVLSGCLVMIRPSNVLCGCPVMLQAFGYNFGLAFYKL